MGEDNTRKVVILLLILAIVFSAVSIFVGFSALHSGPSERSSSQGGSSGFAGIGLVVEASKTGAVGK